MRAPAWGGLAPPANDTEARKRLVDAARRCFERLGLERTTVASIAAEAGVTRQTLYRYFSSSEELSRAAFALAAGGIVERMLAHARSFRSPGERIVEAIIFLWHEIPADPQIGPFFNPRRSGARASWSVSSPVPIEISRGVLRALMDERSPLSSGEVDELAEVMLRWLQSLLTDPGPAARSEMELRAFLYRWLVPAIGFPDD